MSALAVSRNYHPDTALEEATAGYRAANPASAARHRAAGDAMPGGNTRTILHFDPFPLTLLRGEGCRVESLDGQELIDFLCEYSAGLYGHSNPVIQAAVRQALADGLVLGAPNRFEAGFAEEIVGRFRAIERVRFCNSGSEATLMCLSLARALTGRREIVAFKGAYHGGFLYFPEAPGPLNAPFDVQMADYNDLEGTRAHIRERGAALAAVILEPMMGAGGCIPADQAFLDMLREETAESGALLIFDEVMTSRLSPGGYQALAGVLPDLTALGKYLGGGLTFGAFGGRADLMAAFDPTRPGALPHAGTFNNNVLTMAAGLAGLRQVLTPEAITALNQRGDRLRRRLQDIFDEADLAITLTGCGSMMAVHFLAEAPRNGMAAQRQDPRLKRLWHLFLLSQGIYASPRGMLTLSLPMGAPEMAALERAVIAFIAAYRSLLPKRGTSQ